MLVDVGERIIVMLVKRHGKNLPCRRQGSYISDAVYQTSVAINNAQVIISVLSAAHLAHIRNKIN